MSTRGFQLLCLCFSLIVCIRSVKQTLGAGSCNKDGSQAASPGIDQMSLLSTFFKETKQTDKWKKHKWPELLIACRAIPDLFFPKRCNVIISFMSPSSIVKYKNIFKQFVQQFHLLNFWVWATSEMSVLFLTRSMKLNF